MNKKIRRRNTLSLVAFVLFATAMTFAFTYSQRESNRLKRNHEIATCRVTRFTSAAKSFGGFLNGYFILNGDTIAASTRSTKINKYYGNEFVGRQLPVIYERGNPSNNDILVFPSNFEEYGLPFPDSLAWVKNFEY